MNTNNGMNLAGVTFACPPRNTPLGERAIWDKIISNSGFWFSTSSMRFFKCRIAWGTLTSTGNGFAFISSEDTSMLYYPQEPRRYTVREWTLERGVSTLGEFQQYDTLSDAKKALRELRAVNPIKLYA